ncbi:hypothetical protein HQ560_15845, partial [bacterium]|nr:hypothetical protein [bacterium]
GMVDEWLHDSVGAWLRCQAKDDVTIEWADAKTLRGHAVETLSGTRGASGIQRLFVRPAHYEAAAWRCPADGRLYRVTTTGQPPHELAGCRLTCCPELRTGR